MGWLEWFKKKASGASRKMPSRRLRRTMLRLEELENRFAPANIVLTSAFLVNANDVPLASSPDKGEQVFLQANWTTQGLPGNASYRVGFTVDGVILFSPILTAGGGGAGTQSWFWYLGGWFASPGTHNVTVTANVDQSIEETTLA